MEVEQDFIGLLSISYKSFDNTAALSTLHFSGHIYAHIFFRSILYPLLT